MGKVYIGVTAVGGHKLWGVGGKRVAGLGGLGDWVSGGRLTAGGGEVAGRACPAPTGWWKDEQVLVEGDHSASNSCSRIHFRMRRSRREIWTWVVPRTRAVSLWVRCTLFTASALAGFISSTHTPLKASEPRM